MGHKIQQSLLLPVVPNKCVSSSNTYTVAPCMSQKSQVKGESSLSPPGQKLPAQFSLFLRIENFNFYKRPRRASLLPIIYFMGNRILLSCFIVRMAAKSPFCLPSILLPEAMDQSGTPLRLMLRPPSFYQGPICQVWSSRLDGTWQQPKVVELGISKIANYNSSWMGLGKLLYPRVHFGK